MRENIPKKSCRGDYFFESPGTLLVANRSRLHVVWRRHGTHCVSAFVIVDDGDTVHCSSVCLSGRPVMSQSGH